MAARKVQQRSTQTKKKEEEVVSEDSKTEDDAEETASSESEDGSESGAESGEETSESTEEGDKKEEVETGEEAENSEEESESESENGPDEKPSDKHTAFIKGLANTITEKDVQEMFGKYGEVKEVSIPKPREPRFEGETRGIAYVEFVHKSACRASMELDNTVHNDRKVTVNMAAKMHANRDEQKQRDSDAPGNATTLFIGNLPFEIDNDEFINYLKEHADLKDIRIPTEKESGRPRGFGFAEFDTKEEADKLLNANLEYRNRELRIKRSEKERSRQMTSHEEADTTTEMTETEGTTESRTIRSGHSPRTETTRSRQRQKE